MAENLTAAGGKLKVFISYSRKDASEFAEELVGGLTLAGFAPMLDLHDIAQGEDYQARLSALIKEADTVVFVVTPESVKSESCERELKTSLELPKRVLPVMWIDVPEADWPANLKKPQYTFFSAGRSFTKALAQLTKALRADLPWIRNHTRFEEYAVRWKERGRPHSALLGATDLKEATLWLARVPKDAPEPTVLQKQFIEESQHAASRGTQWVVFGSLAVVTMALALAGWAVIERFEAQKLSGDLRIERDNILLSQSRLLADRALQAILDGDHVRGMLLSLEGMQDLDHERDQQRVRPYATKAAATLLLSMQRQMERVVLGGHNSSVSHVTFSDDGRLMLSASKSEVLLWNSEQLEQIKLIRLLPGLKQQQIQGATLTGDGRKILVSYPNGAVIVDIKTGGRDAFDAIEKSILSPDGTMLLKIGAADQHASILDLVTKSERRLVETNNPRTHAEVRAISFSDDGQLVATGSWSPDDKAHYVHVWNTALTKVLSEIRIAGAKKQEISSIRFSRDQKMLVIIQKFGDISVRDNRNDPAGELPVIVLKGHAAGPVNSAEFSADSKLVLTSSNDNTARLWNAESGVQLAVLRGHGDDVNYATFTSDGGHVATASYDKTVRIWRIPREPKSREPEFRVLGEHDDIVQVLAFSPDGKFLATGGNDNTARVWDLAHPGKYEALMSHGGIVQSVAFDKTGDRVLTAFEGGTGQIWDARTGKQIGQPIGKVEERIYRAYFSPDAKRVATASFDGLGRVWNADTGEFVCLLGREVGTKAMSAAVFSPDGKLIATGSEDNDIIIWNAATCQRDGAPLSGHTGAVSTVAFNEDGSKIVTTSSDQSARIWSVADRKPIQIFNGHTDTVNSAHFDRRGLWIVTTSNDRTARVWDVATGMVVAVLVGHLDDVNDAAFSPDARYIATVSNDRSVRIWDLRQIFPSFEDRNKQHLEAITAARYRLILGANEILTATSPEERDRQRRQFIALAKQLAPRCLSVADRVSLSLEPVVPAWCKTLGKWPDHQPDPMTSIATAK